MLSKKVSGTFYRKEGFMTNRFHVIPHVHWDREWYFTQNKSTLYLLHDLTEIIETLEKNDQISYYLFDAQTSLIDDYLKYMPQMEDRVRKLISEKRLLTGPWYTQTDQMIIHGESIVRNLIYGIEEAEDYGYCFRVGHAVDCFGQNVRMPQIYEGVGVPYTLFKRGIEFDEIPSTEFLWKDDDGSLVKAYHGIDYLNFRNPSSEKEKNIEKIKKIEEAYAPRSRSGEMLLFNGFDQHPIRKDIVRIVDDLKDEFDIDMMPLEEVLEKSFEVDDLPEYKGELVSGQTSRVHKSIYSSRADLKIANAKAENKLVRIAEPLQAIFYELTGRENREVLKSLWKLMMENAAHDSIGCCNSDEVNRQIAAKFAIVHDTANEYIDLTMRKIANLLKGSVYDVQLYNLLPYERTENIDLSILSPYRQFALKDSKGNVYPVEVRQINDVTKQVKGAAGFVGGANGNYEDIFGEDTVYLAKVNTTVSVSPMGYETFKVVESDEVKKAASLENDDLKISVNDNGSLTVYDKKKDHTYQQVLVFEDGADAGDSYDWSSYPYDEILTSEGSKAYDVVYEANSVSYKVDMDVPADLEERKNRIYSKKLTFRVELSLRENKPEIDVRVKVDNTATDHRVRVLVKTDIPSERSYADTIFGDISRPVYLPKEKVWREEKWDEKPRTVESLMSYTYLKNDDRCVGVVTDSVKEYQIVSEDYDTIAYTLYRSFPYMGRSELPDRPGRASGQVEECYDDNLFKELEFTFALVFPENRDQIVDLASEYTTPLLAYQDGVYSYTGHQFLFCRSIYDGEVEIPENYSAFHIPKGNSKLSIYKLAEHGSDTIIRVFQDKDGSVDVNTDAKLSVCDLREMNDQPYDRNRTYVKNKIITLKKEGKNHE